MSATINKPEKSMTSVKKAETIAARRAVEMDHDESLSPMERARLACRRSQNEDFELLGRILGLR